MKHRNVKIIATVGPACSKPEQLKTLVEAGVNVFRFNFAHSTREDHAASIAEVKRLAGELGIQVGTLADLSGPKIRLGEISGDTAMLTAGEVVTLRSLDMPGEGLPILVSNFDQYVEPGDPIYIADGSRKLTVTDCSPSIVHAVVDVGGAVSSFKGVNLPNLQKPLPAVVEKDLLDAAAALRAGVDWISLSFVSDPKDQMPILEMMRRMNIRRPIIAKLERRRALDRLEEIVAAFDGVMVARGDLGIEVEFEKVPSIQDRILRSARNEGKPAVVATQILTSMLNSPRPTRAEVTDIAYAVSGGADALMLSEETAIGRYGVEAVSTIAKVAHEIEAVGLRNRTDSLETVDANSALAHTAVVLARDTKATAILCPTHSGNGARTVAQFRPDVPIVVVSDVNDVVGELTLYRGVHARRMLLGETLDTRIETALKFASELGLASPGDKLVILGGMPAGLGRANLLLVHSVLGS